MNIPATLTYFVPEAGSNKPNLFLGTMKEPGGFTFLRMDLARILLNAVDGKTVEEADLTAIRKVLEDTNDVT